MPDSKHISAEFPYDLHFVEIKGYKIHYIDEGSGDTVLFLHGNPTSSYLWRNIIPYMTSVARCIAPDLIGMGKSDKPDIEYRFFDHYEYIEEFIDKLELSSITFVIHDWGSALGLHYAMSNEDNVKGIAMMEAILMPVSSWDMWPEGSRKLFQSFRTPEIGWDMIVNKNIFVEELLPGAVVRKLSEEEMDYYREPFKEPDSRRPVWKWPNEIPIEGEPADVTEAVDTYNKKLRRSDLPKILFYAVPGVLIRKPMVKWCRENLKNLKLVDTGRGIHYIQEDNPHLIGVELRKWYENI